MKRTLALVLAICLAFVMCACGKSVDKEDSHNSKELSDIFEEAKAQQSDKAEEPEKDDEPEPAVCKNCEAELPADVKFCPECGTSVESDDANEPETTFCKECEAELAADAKFCTECGTSVETDTPSTPAEEFVEAFDITPYFGTWATSGSCYEYGGTILTVSSANGDLCFDLSHVQGAPGCRVVSLQASLPLENVQVSSFTWTINDDGWGNTAEIFLDFYDGTISLDIYNVMPMSDLPYAWGLSNASYLLMRDDDVYEAMEGTCEDVIEEGFNARPDDFQIEEQHDMSKASGILASLGMSEEEFRANCTPLSPYKWIDNEILVLTSLREYPAQYIGQSFYTTSKYNVDLTTGERIPLYLEVWSKGTSSDGYTFYEIHTEDEYLLLFDLRDDIYAPTISKGDNIYPYMIFNEMQTISGIDYLCFSLISVDKV